MSKIRILLYIIIMCMTCSSCGAALPTYTMNYSDEQGYSIEISGKHYRSQPSVLWTAFYYNNSVRKVLGQATDATPFSFRKYLLCTYGNDCFIRAEPMKQSAGMIQQTVVLHRVDFDYSFCLTSISAVQVMDYIWDADNYSFYMDAGNAIQCDDDQALALLYETVNTMEGIALDYDISQMKHCVMFVHHIIPNMVVRFNIILENGQLWIETINRDQFTPVPEELHYLLN